MIKWNIKKAAALSLALLLALAMAACGQPAPAASPSAPESTPEATPETSAAEAVSPSPKESAEPVSLTVFAAASMTETITKVAEMYKSVAPNVTLTLNFDSSGTLKTQIQEGAECDVFISAAQKQMNQLDSSKSGDDNPDGLDFVEQGTRVNILENKVTLVVPKDNPKGVKSFDDMAGKLKDGGILMAMGNSDVPVGQYTQKILAYYKLDEKALADAGSITYGSNVKEVTTQVSEASVDCGVVYCTDAYSAGLEVVDSATAEMCGQVIYPAAVLNISKNKEAAQAFLDYLKTDDCMNVFKEVGFSPAV
jgi:molybdate transport system substrate-binding protein